MGQSYSIHVCTRANEMHYSSVHVHFVVAGFTDLEKNLTVYRKCRAYGTLHKICGKSHYLNDVAVRHSYSRRICGHNLHHRVPVLCRHPPTGICFFPPDKNF